MTSPPQVTLSVTESTHLSCNADRKPEVSAFHFCVVLCTVTVAAADLLTSRGPPTAVDTEWMRRWGESLAPWYDLPPNATVCSQPVSGGSATLGIVVYTAARSVPTRDVAWISHLFLYVNLAASASAHCTGVMWTVALDQASLLIVVPAPAIFVSAHRGDAPLLLLASSALLLFEILNLRDVAIAAGLTSLCAALYRHVPSGRRQLRLGVSVFLVSLAFWTFEQAFPELIVCRYGAAHAAWHVGGALTSALLIDALSLWEP